MRQIPALARLVVVGVLTPLLAACGDFGGSEVSVEPAFLPVEFSLDMNGQIHVSLNERIVTPLGAIGLKVDWAKAVFEEAKKKVPDKAERGIKIVIDHDQGGQPHREGFFLDDKGAVACLDGRFALSNEGGDKILLQVLPNSTIRFVEAESVRTECASASADSPCRLHVTLNAPLPGQPVPLTGTPVKGRVQGDLSNCQLWLFKYAPVAQKHFLGGPLTVLDGQFEGTTGQVGSNDPQERGVAHLVEIVSTDRAASQEIQAAAHDGQGDVAFKSLPLGAVVPVSVSVIRK